MPADFPDESERYTRLAPGVVLPNAALRFRFDRSGGPGGQNVNKLNTRATLTVSFADLATVLDADTLQRVRTVAGHWAAEDRLVISAANSRSQLANRRACVARLRWIIEHAARRPRPRRPTRPTRGAVERRLQAKAHRSRIKRLRRGQSDQ